MKPLFLASLIPALAISAFAQAPAPAPAPFAIKAAFITKEERPRSFVGAVVAATAAQIEYRSPIDAEAAEVANIKDFEIIFFMEPAEYNAAMDLFELGKFEDAKAQFKKYKDQTKAVGALPGNYHVLAAYYELECLRNLGDYKGLTEALATFPKAQLTREYQLRQLELYVLWDALNAGAWERLLTLALDREKQKMPDSQFVQVQYCKGIALQKLERLDEAAAAFDMVITADSACTENLTSKAALATLGIYHKDASIQEAIALWGTDKEMKGSLGYTKLLQAAALAKVYQLYFNHIKELPPEFKKFMDYKVKEDAP